MFKIINFLVILVPLFILPLILSAQITDYDTLRIYDIQYVTDPSHYDKSPFLNDTVVVKGLVMNYPRELWVGARWATYIIDYDNFPNPWSGFFIIQHDTFAVNTNFGEVEPGMICYFTGIIDEYVNFTELALLTEPEVPVDIVSTDNPLPQPYPLTTYDITHADNAEQWESMWIYLEDVIITDNDFTSYRAIITDISGGQSYLGDYFLSFYKRLKDETYEWPHTGTRVNLKGFIRNEGIYYSINPRTEYDMGILSNPPLISNLKRNPGSPSSADEVTISANIVDNNSVNESSLHYSINWDDFQKINMANSGDNYSAVIPPQSEGSFVRYFISSFDDVGDYATSPGDTSHMMKYYIVRDGELSIKDIQYNWGYESDISGYAGYEVTIQGVVTSNEEHFSGSYYIQEKDSAWYGLWIKDGNHTFSIGDLVEVTGTVEEEYLVTCLSNVDEATGATFISSGNEVLPVKVNTGDVRSWGEKSEAYESVLLVIENLTITESFPDGLSHNYGEFTVDDGTGGLRVDDASSSFNGNLDSTFIEGERLDYIIGLGYFSFDNYKIIPRDNSDVKRTSSGFIKNEILSIKSFELNQNYPNPFNPETIIKYQLPAAGLVNLNVYNTLGQKVAMLVNEHKPAGTYEVTFDATHLASGVYIYRLTTNSGFSQTKKMILIR